jgi:hypothetical protein
VGGGHGRVCGHDWDEVGDGFVDEVDVKDGRWGREEVVPRTGVEYEVLRVGSE